MFDCLVERLEHEHGVRLERPTFGLLVDELEWAVEDLHDADNSVALPKPRPAETTTQLLARDADWYVLACVVGLRPTQIQTDAAARNEHLDLATIKKAIDAFAALVDLTPYPKRPFAPRPRHPQKRAKLAVDRIRVLIATEHSIVREGLRKLVESEIR